jgi:Arm DNA-binding domain
MKLSQTRVGKMKEPGLYSDGRNLYLQITKHGHRSWIFRYKIQGSRKERFMGLGSCADYTLEEARERARSARQLLKDGIDPLDASREARAKAAATPEKFTFRQAADAYFDMHSAKWTSARHKTQFHERMNAYVFPSMGTLPVASIDKQHVLKAIRPIWLSKHGTASKTLGRIRSDLDYAKASGWRVGDNPAAWAGNLSHALPILASDRHHAALPFAQIYDFMQQLAAVQSIAARALEFTILTAVRTSEARFCTWDEFDGPVIRRSCRKNCG